MENAANTINFFIAGYTVIFGIMIAYFISLGVRWNKLCNEIKILEELEKADSER